MSLLQILFHIVVQYLRERFRRNSISVFTISIKFIMSSKIKLGKLVSSKAAASKTFIIPKQSNNQETRIIRYVTLDNAVHRGDYPSVVNRLSVPRRNHTQNSKYQPKYNRTPKEVLKNDEKKRYSVNTASKSLNLKSNSLDMKGKILENEREELSRDHRFALMREEKIGRLKDLYALKNKHHKANHSLKSGAKINSFGELPSHKHSYLHQQKSKSKFIFHKREDFHYSRQQEESTQRHLPKYLDFCEDDAAQKVENTMPQSLKGEHVIGKVKSIKMFPETPPLVPVTINKENRGQLTLDWFLRAYQPHLQIFQNVAFEGFTMITIPNGTFFGQVNQESGLPEGRGVVFYHNGKIYEGNFRNGEKHGLGYQQYPDHSFYLGNFQASRREGKGKFEWSNGEVYDGQWKDNKKSGSGIWKGKNDLSYVGEWQNDSIEGFGVLIQKGSRYQGQFKNFMKWGKGTLRFDNGEIYIGAFKQNLPNGTGDYYWVNQDHYHGQFTNGKRHGQGILKYSNGGMYHGLFQNDKKSGKGQQHYEDHLFYEGEYENDLRHGWGVLTCQGTTIFQGYWINNSAVDPKRGKIDPIMEQPSRFEKDTSKQSKMRKHESNIGQMRSKHLAQKQSRRYLKINQSKEKEELNSEPKKFQRACNCERHRQRKLEIQI